jgi:spermidine synthase
VYRPGTYLTHGYWDDFLVLPFAARTSAPAPPGRIAILGDAAGSVARAYGHFFPDTRVDAVELDGALTAIGKRYFHLSGPRLHLYTADARPWLQASHARYDSIFMDAYRQPYIPFYLVTRQFFASARAHLRPGGTFIVNVGHLPDSSSLERVVTATLRAVFPYVVRDRVSADNSLLVASTGPLSAASMLAAHAQLPLALQGLLASTSGRLGPPLGGGAVYTDDKAPVEWLTDLSILRYAAGTR